MGRGREKCGYERETLIIRLPYRPQPGIKPTTLVCVLTWHHTQNILEHRRTLNQLSHPARASGTVFVTSTSCRLPAVGVQANSALTSVGGCAAHTPPSALGLEGLHGGCCGVFRRSTTVATEGVPEEGQRQEAEVRVAGSGGGRAPPPQTPPSSSPPTDPDPWRSLRDPSVTWRWQPIGDLTSEWVSGPDGTPRPPS